MRYILFNVSKIEPEFTQYINKLFKTVDYEFFIINDKFIVKSVNQLEEKRLAKIKRCVIKCYKNWMYKVTA